MDSDALRIQRALLTEPEPKRPFDWEDRLVMAACAVSLVWVLLLSIST